MQHPKTTSGSFRHLVLAQRHRYTCFLPVGRLSNRVLGFWPAHVHQKWVWNASKIGESTICSKNYPRSLGVLLDLFLACFETYSGYFHSLYVPETLEIGPIWG